MKSAFYLENRDIPDVDLSRPELGNPGCGGAEYLFAALPYYLATLQGQACRPLILANHVANLPLGVAALKVDDVCDAARCAKREGVSFFLYRPRRNTETELLELIDVLQLPTIAWAHITPTGAHLRRMANTVYLKAVVCVEHEQYDLAQDSAVWRKLTYIVNGFDLEGFQLPAPPAREPGLVVYLGALVPQKGFHQLAKAWARILRRHPEARLAVIGTGALYQAGVQLGRWGVAESSYEERFIMPYLADENGFPHASVQFLGKLGIEKKEILYRAMVGVPNPTGQTECCPGTALEFQASGTAVVSGAYYGMLDTVQHGKTGLLGHTEDDLVANICSLLDDPVRAEALGWNGIEFVRERYNFIRVTSNWVDLFDRLAKEAGPRRIPFKPNLVQHSKLLIRINRFLQMMFGRIVCWPSVVEMKIYIFKTLQAMEEQVSSVRKNWK